MNAKSIVKAALVTPVTMLLCANSAPQDAQEYTMDMKITDNGVVIATPTILVDPDARSRIKVEQAGSSYEGRMVFAQTGRETLMMISQWQISSPAHGEVTIAPELEVKLGESARIVHESADEGMSPFEVEFSIKQN